MKAFEFEDQGDYVVYKDHLGTKWKRYDNDFSHIFYMLQDGALGEMTWHYDGMLYRKIDTFYDDYDEEGGISLTEVIHTAYLEKEIFEG